MANGQKLCLLKLKKHKKEDRETVQAENNRLLFCRHLLSSSEKEDQFHDQNGAIKQQKQSVHHGSSFVMFVVVCPTFEICTLLFTLYVIRGNSSFHTFRYFAFQTSG